MITTNKNNKEIIDWLIANNIPYLQNIEINKKSWLKAGGTAEVLIQPESIEDAIKTIKYFVYYKIDYYPVGNLSNTLFRDGLIKTPLINLKNFKNPIIKNENSNENNFSFKVSSGLSLFKFVTFLQSSCNLTGQEGLIGIPGTIGGAIYTNASSYGSCISDYLTKLEFIDHEGNMIILDKDKIKFGWRYSIFHEMKKFLILYVYFNFPKRNVEKNETIQKNIAKIKDHRIKFQENNLPNLGSLYATKNLYRDLSKVSIVLFFLYCFYLVGTKFIYFFFNGKYLLDYRKFICKLYCKYFKINGNNFSLSDRTINCLVNKGSNKTSEAFELINKIEKKINNKIRLENILLKNIK